MQINYRGRGRERRDERERDNLLKFSLYAGLERYFTVPVPRSLKLCHTSLMLISIHPFPSGINMSAEILSTFTTTSIISTPCQLQMDMFMVILPQRGFFT